MKRSTSSDDGEETLDLASLSALDDDISWLYTSPSKPGLKHLQAEEVKKKMLAVFERPEILHMRRALSHKLRDIEKGTSPVVQSLFSGRSASTQSRSYDFEGLASSHTSSLDNSFNSALSEPLADPHNDEVPGSYTNGANASLVDDLSSVKPSPSREMAAGDFSSSTFVRRRNQTRTIESSSILEAQRLLADGSPTSGAEMSEHGDSLSALPDEFVKRRLPTGNTEDKSKRESLDIQTLAKLQEQSLRDSLSAVRKASNASSSSSTGVPGLSLSDLDSSTGSLSSSNEESFYRNTAPTLELNGDTPILHKSVVNSQASSNTSGTGRRSPQIRSSLSPRSIQAPKPSGLRKPASSLPGPSQSKPRASGIVPPRSGLRPPSNSSYANR